MEPKLSKYITIQHWRSLAQELAGLKAMVSFMLIHSRVNKALHIVDMQVDNQEGGDLLRIVPVMKFGILNGVGDWYWGFNQGRCNGSGSSNLDATHFIENINELKYWDILPYGIWTNVKQIFAGCPDPNEPKPNPFGYWNTYLFGKSGECNPCLTEEEIDYYAEQLSVKTNIAINKFSITNEIIHKHLEEPSTKSYNSPHNCLELFYGDFESQRIKVGDNSFYLMQ